MRIQTRKSSHTFSEKKINTLEGEVHIYNNILDVLRLYEWSRNTEPVVPAAGKEGFTVVFTFK